MTNHMRFNSTPLLCLKSTKVTEKCFRSIIFLIVLVNQVLFQSRSTMELQSTIQAPHEILELVCFLIMIIELLKVPEEGWLCADEAAKLIVGDMMIHDVIEKCRVMLRGLKTQITSCSVFYAMSFVKMNIEVEDVGKDFSARCVSAFPFISFWPWSRWKSVGDSLGHSAISITIFNGNVQFFWCFDVVSFELLLVEIIYEISKISVTLSKAWIWLTCCDFYSFFSTSHTAIASLLSLIWS